jgi:putative ABC transport system permease protein
MFDLNRAIHEWANRLRRNETMDESDLAEIEAHFRDEVDRQMAAGLDPEAAFHAAAALSEPAEDLGREYGRLRFHQKRYPLWHPARLMPALAWNYFKVAVRKFKRQKAYAFINWAGLTVGILCALAILLVIHYELSYDRAAENAEDVYRVVTQWPIEFMGSNKITWTSALLAPSLKTYFPGVAGASRVSAPLDPVSLSHAGRAFSEPAFYFVDPDFLPLFSAKMLRGRPDSALNEPLLVVISENAARRYFPEVDPVGKILRYNDRHDFQVTGVFANPPKNSHFRYDVLASYASLRVLEGPNSRYRDQWTSLNDQTYVRLKRGTEPRVFARVMEDYLIKNAPASQKDYHYSLQPVTKIHLGGSIPGELAPNGDRMSIYIYAAIAVLIILITCLNYINLSTARFSTRVAELHIRRVVGANRRQLMLQFAGETAFLTMAAFAAAVILLLLARPLLAPLTGVDPDPALLLRPGVLAAALGLVSFMVLFSAGFPALYLTSRKPRASTAAFSFGEGPGAGRLRDLFVIVQFVISTALIVATLGLHRQVGFIVEKNFGSLAGTILTIRVSRDNVEMAKGIEEFRRGLEQEPGVEAVAVSSWPPTNIRSGNYPSWEGKAADKKVLFHNLDADYGFLGLYGIPVVQGRNFSKEFPSDPDQAYIVNETAIRLMNLEEPVGKRFGYGDRPGVIIGVVADFHFVPLRQRVAPLAIRLNPTGPRYISVRAVPKTLARTIRSIEERWKKISPRFAFTYSFIDDDLRSVYGTEMRFSRALAVSTLMALFLANLGLFGLTLFYVERKVKEIGIRKVCGAGSFPIVLLLSRDFFKRIVIADVLAVPLAYFALEAWLRGFAYRAPLGPGVFVLASGASLILAGLIILYRAYAAALANPVESLRYE